jgi:hypothetical protein
MSASLSTRDRFGLFVQRVEELSQRRLVRQGMNSKHTIKWDAISQQLTYQAIEPDEEDLRSFLLIFRQFVSDKEPVFISRVLNDCIRFLNSSQLQEYLKKAQGEWKNSFRHMGAFHIVVNERNLTGEYVLDLWINGYYFHNDSDKAAELRRLLTDQLPLVRMQFLTILTSLTHIILYVGNVIRYGFREGLFHFHDES